MLPIEVVTASAVSICLAVPAGVGHGMENGGAAAVETMIPHWEEGDWWVTCSHHLVTAPNNPLTPGLLVDGGVPTLRSVFPVEHKFTVRGMETIGGERCYVIDVRIHKLPGRVRNDAGTEPLWTLYIRDDKTRTLARYAWRLRDYPCHVEGAVKYEGGRNVPRGQPVVPTVDQQVPLDVADWSAICAQGHPLSDNAKDKHYVDDWSRQKWTQTVEAYDDLVRGGLRRVVMMTLWNEHRGLRTQRWVSGYPWWIDWAAKGRNGRVRGGTLRSFLVEFGKKGQKGTRVVRAYAADLLGTPDDNRGDPER